MKITIGHLWDGSAVGEGERISLVLARTPARGLSVTVDAPYHGDPPPSCPAGVTPRLWEHEVVELFVYGAGAEYLELELGPHGHHLALRLDGVRSVVASGLAITYPRPRVADGRWRGQALVDGALLPAGLARVAAHAIHGVGCARRFLSAFPAGGERPDFHRREAAGSLAPALRDGP